MSHTLSIERAAKTLKDLVANLGPNDEIVLTRNDLPVARIVANHRTARARRAGSCKGMLTINQEDDEHLAAFAEYLP